MTRRGIYIAASLAVGVTALAAIGSVAGARARSQADTTRLTEAVAAAVGIQTRLAQMPVSPGGAPSPDHAASLARRLLVAAGVGQDALAGIQPLGDAALPGGTWHRQQVLLQLRNLTTHQASAIVHAVSQTDPAWAVTSIQLNHTGRGDAYDAGLALTTLYPARP